MRHRFIHFLEQLEYACSLLLDFPPSKGGQHREEKEAAAKAAQYTMLCHQMRPTTTKGGKWVRMSAAFRDGHDTNYKDFQAVCESLLHVVPGPLHPDSGLD